MGDVGVGCLLLQLFLEKKKKKQLNVVCISYFLLK